jgi:predicted HTH transcriptional regulator
MGQQGDHWTAKEYRKYRQSYWCGERTIEKGYAAGFGTLMQYVNDQLPTNELIGQAFRSEQKMYPEIALRELVANALLHQDPYKGQRPTRGNFSRPH